MVTKKHSLRFIAAVGVCTVSIIVENLLFFHNLSRILIIIQLTEDVVDDAFADMARHAMLLLVGRGTTIPPEHRRKPRRTEEPNIDVVWVKYLDVAFV
jgi:hypothetical protein